MITWHPASEPPSAGHNALLVRKYGQIEQIAFHGSIRDRWIDGCAFYGITEWAEVPPAAPASVQEPEPEYITPTDEHARSRPACEIRDDNRDAWTPSTLAVVSCANSNTWPFICIRDDKAVQGYKYCRIPKPVCKPPAQELWLVPLDGKNCSVAYANKEFAETCSLPGTKLLRAIVQEETA